MFSRHRSFYEIRGKYFVCSDRWIWDMCGWDSTSPTNCTTYLTGSICLSNMKTFFKVVNTQHTTASRPTKVYGWKFTHHGWISNHYLENQPLVGKPTTLWLEILPPSQPHRCLSAIGSGGKAQLGCIVLSLIFTYLQALFWKYHPDVYLYTCIPCIPGKRFSIHDVHLRKYRQHSLLTNKVQNLNLSGVKNGWKWGRRLTANAISISIFLMLSKES